MSVSDPLIKDIKGCVQQFINLSTVHTPISDNNVYFLAFAQTIEKIFNQGLIPQQNTKYLDRIVNAYVWMIDIVDNNQVHPAFYTYKNCCDQVKDKYHLNGNCAKFRWLIKHCLMKKCLHMPIQILKNSKCSEPFYIPSSILGDDILSEIFLSVLLQVSKINFDLDLKNASFLDVSWFLPEMIDLELVPCKSLGIAVSFTSNRAVIVNVEPNGVAAEDGNVKRGDILDELNNVHINNTSKGRLNMIMRSNKLRPVKIRLIKACYKESGQLYGPIQNLLRDLKIDVEDVKKQYKEFGHCTVIPQNKAFYGYHVKYLANIDVGSLGNVKQVQKALKLLMDNRSSVEWCVKRLDQPVLLEIGEVGLKFCDKESNNLILEHAYMKISSCGSIPFLPKVFGYCVSDVPCDVAKNFICHIFEALTYEEADLILHSIGQGFHRTHYAV
ncbi:hypothetical protein ABEB36_010500 [Hypothenemus hampei]|uniref:PDZ domain-containing protein n=1 Tax=Hypothenemus hampei TaxID=57062 RepID=A0ABD1EMW4_HYPHA